MIRTRCTENSKLAPSVSTGSGDRRSRVQGAGADGALFLQRYACESHGLPFHRGAKSDKALESLTRVFGDIEVMIERALYSARPVPAAA